MHDQEVELAVGDVVRIGNHLLTVIDIDGEDVSFRIDHLDDAALEIEPAASVLPPR